jgi:hypothetical protein
MPPLKPPPVKPSPTPAPSTCPSLPLPQLGLDLDWVRLLLGGPA